MFGRWFGACCDFIDWEFWIVIFIIILFLIFIAVEGESSSSF